MAGLGFSGSAGANTSGLHRGGLGHADNKLVYAAIDFGTSNSGYAFSFRHDPDKIITNDWPGTETPTSVKAPTVVLLNPDGSFHSFGFEAQREYSDLCFKEEQERYYLFSHFKMELYKNEKLSMDTIIYDVEKKPMKAIEIFSMVIQYLKDQLIWHAQNNVADVNNDDIYWTLTVPAIWSDAAKQFMRKAANKAGISNDQLSLALEPEAASLYCQDNYKCKQRGDNGIAELKGFPVGHKYAIIDIGGGTLDMTVHEVIEDENLREIKIATGNDLGACKVDNEFIELLRSWLALKDKDGNIVVDTLDQFCKLCRGDFIDLMNSFEVEKKMARENSTMIFKIPSALTETLQQIRNIDWTTLINEEKLEGRIIIRRDKLQLQAELVNSLFNDTVSKIIEEIKKGYFKQDTIKTLLLVGGFADSHFLNNAVKKAFPDIEVLKPNEAVLHVLKGAVMTMFKPAKIVERIARFTYGFRTEEKFDSTKHPQELMDKRTSGTFCAEVFSKFIEKGQRLVIGNYIQKNFGGPRTNERKNESISIELFRSDKTDPMYCIDTENCSLVGKITNYPPEEGWSDDVNIKVHIKIGETEFRVAAQDMNSGQVFQTTVDFLEKGGGN